MASLIPGFEYDIFISYRQKDNKGGRWVSEFVDALKTELDSTFKEEISVYFDVNPHDGLLESHDVAASLKEKLKCLIFIPVISQTYCDPNSFAWQYEFAAFNKMSKEDQFGRDIRLASGNVASRILPIKIHDLDQEDKATLENELGGVLRSIDFIFKASGVNRPLKPEDERSENLNHLHYRDQINKVANAIKEIIYALKKPVIQDGEPSKLSGKPTVQSAKKHRLAIIAGIILVSVLIVSGYYFSHGLLNSSKPLEKSIALLPFRNLSNDSSQVYFCDGFMEEILNNLQRMNDLTVRSRTSTYQYKNTVKTIKTIAEEMNVNYVIEGSVGREDNNLKIWVQLINAKTDQRLWAKDYTREMKQIFSLQSEIARDIAAELKTVLSPEENRLIDKQPTESLEAYNNYLHGNDYYWRSTEKLNLEIAAKMYENAIESDPEFALAYVRLSLCYLSLHWFHFDPGTDYLARGKVCIDAAFTIEPDLAEAHLALATYHYWGFLNYTQALEEIDIAQKNLRNNSECFSTRGNIYRRAGDWSLSVENYLKAYELDPGSPRIVNNLASTYFALGEYQEAGKYYSKVMLLNPTFIEAIWQRSLMYFKSEGNTIQARKRIAEAYQFNVSSSNPFLFELNVLMDIYDGNYQNALSLLSSNDIDIIDTQLYFNFKSLLYARVYSLINMPEKAREYFDSARITIELMIQKNPDDSRLISAAGIAYAGLGLKEQAVEYGKRAVKLMPVTKDASRGIYRAKDLACIYMMVGEYDAAMEQIKLVLSLPGPFSVKSLRLDPTWKQLWTLPEFEKLTKASVADASNRL